MLFLGRARVVTGRCKRPMKARFKASDKIDTETFEYDPLHSNNALGGSLGVSIRPTPSTLVHSSIFVDSFFAIWTILRPQHIRPPLRDSFFPLLLDIECMKQV
jgi:hypothetical protein